MQLFFLGTVGAKLARVRCTQVLEGVQEPQCCSTR